VTADCKPGEEFPAELRVSLSARIHPAHVWRPHSLISNGYQRFLSRVNPTSKLLRGELQRHTDDSTSNYI